MLLCYNFHLEVVMSSLICPLCSGSDGNSTYIKIGNNSFLVDIGKSCRQIERSMSENKINPHDINFIFITHEHIDHVRGLNVFARKYNIEDGSLEGNGKTKRTYLTMNFPDGEKVCEAHLKYNSVNGEKLFNDVRDCCRVYFSIPTIGDSHIYVGAILNHTKQCN